MRYQVGHRVTWTSQAAGRTATKVGVVTEVVPAGWWPRDGGTGSVRDHESYVVRAAVEGRKGRARLYWPRVSALKPATTGGW